MARPYREDIDWLRATAVISVLGFHWDIPPFRGGYVGVDIFFVISGFLITQIIQAEASEGSFSFANFYERRIRRLLPALYVMAVLGCLPAFYFFLPSERFELFKSVIATITFTSNIFFWSLSGYFDHAVEDQPMLHTWSLSVEEQFYVVLPIFIWALCRRRINTSQFQWTLLSGLCLLGLLSFAASHWLMTHDRVASAFYLSPPRAWEFLVGSLLAIEGMPVLRNVHLRRIARTASIVLILIPVIGYRSKTFFPGTGALLPCIGAALFIWSGMGSGTTARAAWSPLNIASFVGKISYSLYLWHWPLIIYVRFLNIDLAARPYQKAWLLVLTLPLAYASYRYVEMPFRRRSLIVTRRAAFVTAGCATLVLLLASAGGLILAGSPIDEHSSPLERYSRGLHINWVRSGTCFVTTSDHFDDAACLTVVPGKTNILVWGDSIAAHYLLGLRKAFDPERVNFLQSTAAGCFPSLVPSNDQTALCVEQQRRVPAYLAKNKPDLIIMAGLWTGHAGRNPEELSARIAASLSILKSLGIPVVVAGQPVTYRTSLSKSILRARARHVEVHPDDLILPEIFDFDARLKKLIPSGPGVAFVSIIDELCPGRQCPLLIGNDAPLTYDAVHLSDEGSVLAGRYIADAAKQMLPATK